MMYEECRCTLVDYNFILCITYVTSNVDTLCVGVFIQETNKVHYNIAVYIVDLCSMRKL